MAKKRKQASEWIAIPPWRIVVVDGVIYHYRGLSEEMLKALERLKAR